MNTPADEPLLEDEYPIYTGYFYVVDGKVYRHGADNMTAAELKHFMQATEVRRCDLHARGLMPGTTPLDRPLR